MTQSPAHRSQKEDKARASPGCSAAAMLEPKDNDTENVLEHFPSNQKAYK